MSHIFVSYSHQDSEYVTSLAQALEREGFDVWIDARIDYGSQWPRVIQEYLDKCAAFIVVMTPRSFESDWVQNELARAQSKKKPIFPVLLEGDGPWLSVQATQYIDVVGGELPSPEFYNRVAKFAPRSKPAAPSPTKFDFSQWLPKPSEEQNPGAPFPAAKEAEILSAVRRVTQQYESWSIADTTLLGCRITLSNRFVVCEAQLTKWKHFSIFTTSLTLDTTAAILESLGWAALDGASMLYGYKKSWPISALLGGLAAAGMNQWAAAPEAITSDLIAAITRANLFPDYHTIITAKVE